MRDLNPKVATDGWGTFHLNAHFCTCCYYLLYFKYF